MWVLGHGLIGAERGMRTQQWILAAWEHGWLSGDSAAGGSLAACRRLLWWLRW